MSGAKKVLMAAAGNAGGDPVYVDDVFSTHIYAGNGGSSGSTQEIVNGIDLDDKGGLVWLRWRGGGGYGSSDNGVWDTERGINKYIKVNNTSAEINTGTGNNASVSAFNSDGFSLGKDVLNGRANPPAGSSCVSWTFAKQEKFFDVVTFTGNGAASRQIPHSLGTEIGMIILINTLGAGRRVWHRAISGDSNDRAGLTLNTREPRELNRSFWPESNGFTSEYFTVGGSTSNSSDSGADYVAYLFAHNNNDGIFGEGGDEDIIKCDTYTGTGNGEDGKEVNLGFEPQFLMVKNDNDTADWNVVDSSRGVDISDYVSSLQWNDPEAEVQNVPWVNFTSTGFKLRNAGTAFDKANNTYIYMAIARPHKPIESAAEGFKTILYDGNDTENDGIDLLFNIQTRTIATGLPFDIDMSITQWRSGTQPSQTSSLMARGVSRAFQLHTHSNAVMSQVDNTLPRFSTRIAKAFALHAGGTSFLNLSSRKYVSWNWRRAQKFFDIVVYRGNSSNRSITHGLKAIPEMMWVKNLGDGRSWAVYHKALTTNNTLTLDTHAAQAANGYFNESSAGDPTASVFHVTDSDVVNASGYKYAAFLWATVPGISKVGSYVGNSSASNSGSNQNIDCGFSNGARFVIIKVATALGAWAVFDTQRGIIAAEDPILQLHVPSVEYDGNNGGADYIDPHSSGFTVLATGGGDINEQGKTYIFYAIAT